MKRVAFVMRLKDGGLAEYTQHHANIWPELVAEIEKSGIAQITIFEKDPMLVLYSEIYDEDAWNKKVYGPDVIVVDIRNVPKGGFLCTVTIML